MLQKLWLTALPTHYNSTLLTYLPEYCVYIETPGMRTVEGLPVYGFFAMAEGTPELVEGSAEPRETRRMWLLIDVAESPGGSPQQKILTFSLNPSTLGDAVKTIEEVTDQGREARGDLVRWLEPLVSQILYICSEEPEIRSQSGPRKTLEMPTATKTRKGVKIFVPHSATIWDCGWRTGALVRKAKEQAEARRAAGSDEQRTSPRGHTRRAHWHLFWAGPRSLAAREQRIKYLPMLRVNLPDESTEAMPAVIHPVTTT